MDRKGPRSWRWILLPKAHELRRKTTATAEASGFLPSWIASSKKPTAFLFCDRWAMRVSLCGKENRNFKREFSSPVLFLQNVCERHQFHVLQTRGYGLLENAPSMHILKRTSLCTVLSLSLSLSLSLALPLPLAAPQCGERYQSRRLCKKSHVLFCESWW